MGTIEKFKLNDRVKIVKTYNNGIPCDQIWQCGTITDIGDFYTVTMDDADRGPWYCVDEDLKAAVPTPETPKRQFYMIVRKSDGALMAAKRTGYTKGYTFEDLVKQGVPRLFTRRQDANAALKVWLKGKCVWRTNYDGEDEMAIVAVSLSEVA